ncbi:MAG: WXG100 family type VII secretion target [Coriobacteriales bacterium]|jgi:WXG100 family type VII secretion target|nr:WXG100 family type VII secretion target [Coriobacteriales bacterium]
MVRRVEIDLNKLAKAQSAYTRVVRDLESSIKSLDKAINLLKNSGWKSSAATAYFKHYNNAWTGNMTKRVKMLKHIESCLQKAREEYLAIYDELKSLYL